MSTVFSFLLKGATSWVERPVPCQQVVEKDPCSVCDWTALVLTPQGVCRISSERSPLPHNEQMFFSTECWQVIGFCYSGCGCFCFNTPGNHLADLNWKFSWAYIILKSGAHHSSSIHKKLYLLKRAKPSFPTFLHSIYGLLQNGRGPLRLISLGVWSRVCAWMRGAGRFLINSQS